MQDTVKKETMEEIAELFKGFADPTRVHILWLLAGQELCDGNFRSGGTEPECHFSSVAVAKTDAPDQIPPGRKKYPLLPGR